MQFTNIFSQSSLSFHRLNRVFYRKTKASNVIENQFINISWYGLCFLCKVLRALSKCGSMYALLCLILCNPMDRNPPGSSVHEISQVRIQKWVNISFSRGSSWQGSNMHLLHWQVDSSTTEPPGKWQSRTHPFTNLLSRKYSIHLSVSFRVYNEAHFQLIFA